MLTEIRWMLLKIWSLLMLLAWISRSLIQLLVKTMFTMAASCARVNIGPLPHWCPRPSILCKKKYTCSLLSNVTVNNIDDKYSKFQFQCTGWLAYLFSRWNVRITDATVFLLRFGWTLCPASISVLGLGLFLYLLLLLFLDLLLLFLGLFLHLLLLLFLYLLHLLFELPLSFSLLF